MKIRPQLTRIKKKQEAKGKIEDGAGSGINVIINKLLSLYCRLKEGDSNFKKVTSTCLSNNIGINFVVGKT